MSTRRGLGATLAACLLVSACGLDLNDPNFPPEDVVFADPTGLFALAIGLQAEYSENIATPIAYMGLVVDELGAGVSTFQNFKDADIGAQLDPATDLSTAPWSGMYRVIKLSNDLLRSVPDAQLDPGTRSGLLALARLHKAMAFGWLLQMYEQAPIDAGIDNPEPEFDARAELVAEVLALLNAARADIATTPPSAEFNSQIIAPGFDLENTIDAMLARFHLIAGNYQDAIDAALRVTGPSELRYSATDRNSLRVLTYLSGNAWQLRPEQILRTEAEAGDERVEFWVQAASVAGQHHPLDELNQYRADDAPFPLYLPDEMTLIRAEAHARLGELDEARDLINEVRTQCPAAGVTPMEPMPCLPALADAQLANQAAILAEILEQRRFELFLQGLRYETLRRFGQPLKYPWVPYPTSECTRNANAPCS
jgi:starch-binding outer membrane protein, SusD/RagB family